MASQLPLPDRPWHVAPGTPDDAVDAAVERLSSLDLTASQRAALEDLTALAARGAAAAGPVAATRDTLPDPLPAVRAPDRLEEVRATGMLDAPPEPVFDRLTAFASQLLGVPISLVVLVDEDRQFFASQHGLTEPWASARQTPLSYSVCQYVVASGSRLVVDDAREHPVLRDNDGVRDIDVVAYAGAPLDLGGERPAGSFCAISDEPRRWSVRDLEILETLAEAASAEMKLRAALEHSRRHDALTGLPNRRAFIELVGCALDRRPDGAGGVVVMTVGLDGLSRINGLVGPSGGDALLRLVGDRLADATAGVATLARVDGDVFALVAEQVSHEASALAHAESMLDLFDDAFPLASGPIDVGATVGVALCRSDRIGAEQILEAANIAMLRGKRAGGGRVEVDDASGRLQAVRIAELTAHLRRALRHEELHVVFQPIVALTGDEPVVAGAEALLRWSSPQLGLVGPDEFIPVAESSGLIVPIGAWVLDRACA